MQAAQFEAKTELEIIKKELMENFNELQVKKDKETEELKKYEESAAEEVKQIRADFDSNKDEVMKLMIDNILNINISLPKVVIGNFEEDME